MMDSPTSADSAPPEVTIEPADNGYVVRHYQRGSKKDESGRTIRRVASTTDEALGHAKTALSGGSGKISKKKVSARVGTNTDTDTGGAIGGHSITRSSRGRARRRRARIGGRR